jgi:hypothetical protein
MNIKGNMYFLHSSVFLNVLRGDNIIYSIALFLCETKVRNNLLHSNLSSRHELRMSDIVYL